MTLFGAEDLPPRRVSLVRLSSELAKAAAGLGRVAVEGEVVRPRTLGSGRVFFTLRDRAAQLRVTFSGAQARRCRAEHGERVCVTGTLTFAPDRGEVVLAAEEVTPVGAGAIAAMLTEARRRLEVDGLLGRPRRRLPRLPRSVGVVCGAEAAVRADIESVVAVRFAGYPVRFVETNVSGPGAAAAITSALQGLLTDAAVEVVILARGGGDAAQLLPFSDEELCRAVAASPVPVVTAIGHESDRPLCDEVADLRCATPSLAAAAVVPERAVLEGELSGLLAAMGAALEQSLASNRLRLRSARPAAALDTGFERAGHRLAVAGNRWRLLVPRPEDARRRLRSIDHHGALTRRLMADRRQLTERRRTLLALDPDLALRRGYAVVRQSDGTVVRSARQVGAGERLRISLAEGSLDVEVRNADG